MPVRPRPRWHQRPFGKVARRRRACLRRVAPRSHRHPEACRTRQAETDRRAATLCSIQVEWRGRCRPTTSSGISIDQLKNERWVKLASRIDTTGLADTHRISGRATPRTNARRSACAPRTSAAGPARPTAWYYPFARAAQVPSEPNARPSLRRGPRSAPGAPDFPRRHRPGADLHPCRALQSLVARRSRRWLTTRAARAPNFARQRCHRPRLAVARLRHRHGHLGRQRGSLVPASNAFVTPAGRVAHGVRHRRRVLATAQQVRGIGQGRRRDRQRRSRARQ